MHFTTWKATFRALALVALLAAPSLTHAGPITPDGTWNPFSWTSGPGAWQTETPFTFTLTGNGTLDVVDAFAQGDRFESYYEISPGSNSLLGITSQVNGPANFMPGPDPAWLSPGFSKGSWQLGPGSYSITFKNVQIAEGAPDGTAYFRVTADLGGVGGPGLAQVPEPGTLLLAAFGAVGLAYPGLRRRWSRRPEQIATPA